MLTAQDLAIVVKGLTPVFREYVAAAIEPHVARVKFLEAHILELEQRAVVPGPIGLPGERGEKGDPGEPGAVGPVGPKGMDGSAGAIGEKGLTGDRGERGADGRDGKDGTSIQGPAGERGEKGIDGMAGRDGKDGIDGITMDASDLLKAEYDGERTLTLTFGRGEHTKSIVMRLPIPIYDDVYKEGKFYGPADLVTWNGGMWIAKQDTTTKPGSGPDAAKAWRLSVKPGRDGRVGPIGPEGKQGPRGPQGERGPERW